MSFTIPSYRIILTILLTAILSGCYTPDTSNLSKQPLVIDITAVARALGRDKDINSKLEEARVSLNTQLSQIGSSLENQLQEKKTELEASSKGKKSEEIIKSEQELQQLTLQAQLKLKQTQQLAEQKASIFRAQLLNEFRQEVAAVAQTVAEKRGAVTVLAINADYLWYASSIDITDEVIGLMRAQPGKIQESTTNSAATDETEK